MRVFIENGRYKFVPMKKSIFQWNSILLSCKNLKFLIVFAILICVASGNAFAVDNNAYILRGVAKIMSAAFQLPGHLIQDSVKSFPFGLVTGAVNGAFQTFWSVLSGGLDIAKGGAPYAKYALFL